jgi:hypothetical protein
VLDCSEFWDFCEELTPSAVRMQTFCSAMALRNSLFWCSTGVLPTVLPNHLKIMGLILFKVTTFSAHVQAGGVAFFMALPKICTETHSGATEIRYLISGRDGICTETHHSGAT